MGKFCRALVIALGLLALPVLAAAPASSAVAPPARFEELARRADGEGPLRLVVQIVRPGSGPAVAEAARLAGGRDVRSFELMPYVTLVGGSAAIRALAANPSVVKITEDVPEPPTLNSTLPIINADDVRGLGFTGVGQTVAILDTGIDADQPFFDDNNGGTGTSRILSQACFSTVDGPNQRVSLCANGLATDLTSANIDGEADCLIGGVNRCDHGTHVAGIAAGDGTGVAGAPTSGVAPDAGIIAIQVFTRLNRDADCGGDPGDAPCIRTFAADQIAGLNRVLQLENANASWNVVAANMSLGNDTNNTAACDGDSRKAAIDTLLAAGIATVISAGNEGHPNGVGAPGCVSTAVTVGSTNDDDTVSDFSNRGPRLDLFAPGNGVNSSVINGFGSKDGTSMAAPHVTGAFAVLRQASPARTIANLLSDLQTTGVPITYATVPMTTATTPRINLLAALAVTTPVADLSVVKSCPSGPVVPGDTVVCTLTVTNSGPSDATTVLVTDTLPAGLTVAALPVPGGGGFTCTVFVASPQLRCTKATQANGSTSVITYGVRVDDNVGPSTTLSNNVAVSAAPLDHVPGNNASFASVQTVACSLSSNAPQILGTPGDDVICGGAGANDIAGGAGNDVIFGGGGNDRLAGSDGNDRLFGGDGDDLLSGGAGDDQLVGNGGANDYAAAGAGVDACTAEFEAACET